MFLYKNKMGYSGLVKQQGLLGFKTQKPWLGGGVPAGGTAHAGHGDWFSLTNPHIHSVQFPGKASPSSTVVKSYPPPVRSVAPGRFQKQQREIQMQEEEPLTQITPQQGIPQTLEFPESPLPSPPREVGEGSVVLPLDFKSYHEPLDKALVDLNSNLNNPSTRHFPHHPASRGMELAEQKLRAKRMMERDARIVKPDSRRSRTATIPKTNRFSKSGSTVALSEKIASGKTHLRDAATSPSLISQATQIAKTFS